MKFKTNIKCGACVATVTPVLDEAVGAGNWSVDLGDPSRILTIGNDQVSAMDIKAKLVLVGYEAVPFEVPRQV